MTDNLKETTTETELDTGNEDVLSELVKLDANVISRADENSRNAHFHYLFEEVQEFTHRFLRSSENLEDLYARIEALQDVLESEKNSALTRMIDVEETLKKTREEIAAERKDVTIDKKVLELVERFADKAQDIVPSSRIYLYGSHVKGTARSSSDIDVAVVVDEIPGYQENARVIREPSDMLETLSFHYSPIEAHLVQALHSNSRFVEVILKTGILIREPRAQK